MMLLYQSLSYHVLRSKPLDESRILDYGFDVAYACYAMLMNGFAIFTYNYSEPHRRQYLWSLSSVYEGYIVRRTPL